MELSDFLAILDIVVTVLIGFVITHMVAVRDSRTRAIKDYYIQELASIKNDINEFYSKLFKGELEAKDIIGWYSANRNRVSVFDTAIRKTFRINEGEIALKLFWNYKNITNSADFNNNYNQRKISFQASTKSAIGRNEKQLYMLIERTLYDINNVRARDYIERKRLEFKSHYLYYRIDEKKSRTDACLSIVKDWLCSHKTNMLIIVLLLFLMFILLPYLGQYIKKGGNDSAQTEQIVQRLDSLDVAVKELSIKSHDAPAVMEPPSNYSIRLNEISAKDTITLRGWIKAKN